MISIQNRNKLSTSLSGGLAELISQQCSCDFTSDAYEYTEVTCSSYGHRLTLDASIAYSTLTGDKTASSVIESLQVWLDMNPKPVLTTSLGSFDIMNECSLLVLPGAPPSCDMPSMTVTNHTSEEITAMSSTAEPSLGVSPGVSVAVFLAGLFFGLCLVAII